MAGNTLKLSLALLVAADAPAHLQRRNLLHNIHLLHLTVALLAFYASTAVGFFLHMNLVRKADEIRNVMHLDPFDGIIVIIVLGDLLNIGLVGSNQTVAAHACVQRRNTRRGRASRRRMAILARNVILASVKFMAERNWLFWLIAHVIDCITWSVHPPRIRRARGTHDHDGEHQG